MLINGISIDTLGIKLYDRVINSNAVDTKQEWLDGDIQPTYVRQQDRFKDIKLSFLVLGTDEDDAFVKISKLTQLIKKSTLSFEDISFTFDVVMRGAAQTERLKNGNFIVSYDLDSDYAKGEREIYTTDATATSVFRLTVVYYQNQTQMLGTEVYTIRAGAFNGENDTLTSIGINVDKYRDEHYNPGVATNLGSMSLTYENLQALNTLIINYSPIKYNFTVNYWLNSGDGYMPTIEKVVSFTYPRLLEVNSIGQLIDIASFKPDGYKGTIDYSGDLTVEDILAASPINVKYDEIISMKPVLCLAPLLKILSLLTFIIQIRFIIKMVLSKTTHQMSQLCMKIWMFLSLLIIAVEKLCFMQNITRALIQAGIDQQPFQFIPPSQPK